jgi:thioredoxin 1
MACFYSYYKNIRFNFGIYKCQDAQWLFSTTKKHIYNCVEPIFTRLGVLNMLEINGDNLEKEVKESKTPVLLDFWAPWCGPCQMMGPVFEELSKDFEGKVKFAKVNTDEQQDIAGTFGISGIPCLVLTKEGKEVERIVGFMPKDDLKKKIEAMLK